MKAIKHVKSEADGLEVLLVATKSGVAVIYRDTDADELISRTNYPQSLVAKAEADFTMIVDSWR